MRKLLFLATLLAAVCAARADEPAADAPAEPVHHGAVHHGTAECECEFSYEMILPLELRQAIDTAHALLKACCPVETVAGAKCEVKCDDVHGIRVLHGVIGNGEVASHCATKFNTKCSSHSQAQCATACKTNCQTNGTAACQHPGTDHCAVHCSKTCDTACQEHCHGHQAHCCADCKTGCGSCKTACNTACSTACNTACNEHCHHACHANCAGGTAAHHPGYGHGRAVLLRFEAPWCGPCQAMTRQVFEHPRFKQALGRHCAVVRINIDDQPELAKRFGVNALPTCVIVTPNGKVIEKVVGAHGEALLARVRAAAGAHACGPAAGCCPAATGCPAAAGCPCMVKAPDCCSAGNTSCCATGNCPACQCGSDCHCAPGNACHPSCSCGGPRVGSRCVVTAGSAKYQGVLRRIDPTWVVVESESGDGVHWIPSRGVECISVPSEPAPGPTSQVYHEPKSDPFGPGIPSGFRVYSVDVANPEACRSLRAGDRINVAIEVSGYQPFLELKNACVFAVSSSIGTGEAAAGVQLGLLLTPQQCHQVQSISKQGHPVRCRVVSVSLDGPAHNGPHKPRSGLIWSFDETGDLLVDHKWTCPAGHEGCVACPPEAPSGDDVHVAPPSLNTSPAQYLEDRWARIPPPNPVYVPQPPRPQTNQEQPIGGQTPSNPYFTPDDAQYFTPGSQIQPEAPPWHPPRRARGRHDRHGHRRQAVQNVDELQQFLVQVQLTETGQDEESKVISRPQLMTVAGQPARVEIDDQFKLEMTITPSSRYEELLEVTVVDGSDETLRSVASIRSGDAFKLQWSGPPGAKRWLECTVLEVEQREHPKHVEYLPEPPPLDPVPPQPLPAPQPPQPQHHVQVYAVADLVGKGAEGKPEFGPLLEKIKSQVAPRSWSEEGGPGLIHPFETNLSIVVRQTPDVHAKLGKFLDQQREKNFSRTVRFETIVPRFHRPAPSPEWEALPAPPTAPRPIAPPPKRPAPPAPPELLPPR